ncbi:hypothetical protein D5S17_35585 [Pseudonocardiaceae bacterium YIM PH 21723]|nr:hypothetical protein D5S17_35585 [Pseudonocardiaceae bacterium YIM PH 21723]
MNDDRATGGEELAGPNVSAPDARIRTTICPWNGCGPDSLVIHRKLVAKAPGTYALAGVTMKLAATELPVLSCLACGHELVGSFDTDGQADFTWPSSPAPQSPHSDLVRRSVLDPPAGGIRTVGGGISPGRSV